MWDNKASILKERAKHTDWTSENAGLFLEGVANDHKAMRWAADDETIPGIARFFARAGAWNASRATAMWEAVFAARRPLSEIDWMGSEEGRSLGFSWEANLANERDRKRGDRHVSPLAVAARRGRLNVVRHLIALGCKVSEETPSLNPLVAHVRHEAWREGTPQLPLMQALVDAGTPLTGGHAAPLFNLIKVQANAAAIPWLKALHAMGMPLWDQDPGTGDTPLHVLGQQKFLKESDAQAWLAELPVTLAAFEVQNKRGQRALDGAEPGPARAMACLQARLLAQHRQTQADQTAARPLPETTRRRRC